MHCIYDKFQEKTGQKLFFPLHILVPFLPLVPFLSVEAVNKNLKKAVKIEYPKVQKNRFFQLAQ